ncbi:MAG: response regulator [Bacteroidales bacterium]|nr:response regulator [Bacteroidales bacterium]
MKLPVTILYVDDEPTNLILFELMFKKSFNVVLAESGYQGLEILQNKPEIKITISDMKMPGMNGIQFIEKAKQKCPDVIFYILTSFEITPEIRDSMQKGLIERYFQKPFNMQEISNSICEKLAIH